MRTRRNANLKRVNIRELMLPIKKSVRQEKRAKCMKMHASLAIQAHPEPRVEVQRAPVDASLLNAQTIIRDQSILINQQQQMIESLQNMISTGASEQLDKSAAPPSAFVYLLLDTESFKVANLQLLPLQIACGVFMWDGEAKHLIELERWTAYVHEVYYDDAFMAEIAPNCVKRHKENCDLGQIAVLPAGQVMHEVVRLIRDHHVSSIVGYNVSWDFAAIRNLTRTLCCAATASWSSHIDARCDNPFNPMGLAYLDLMHEIVKKYGEELTVQGISDGTIHRADDSHRLMLKSGGSRYSKSIYSAQYVLQHFFGVDQEHMAQQDVCHEALLLEKLLHEFGPASLEHNICYPQESCYQRMLHLATKMFDDGEEKDEGQKECVSPAGATETDEVCLFDSSDSV